MTTAIDILMKDHRTVEDLFAKVERSPDDRNTIFERLFEELTLHTEAEETFFYPELELSPETSGEVSQSYKDHSDVKQMLSDLQHGDPASSDWTATLLQLKESVQHHVKKEENELFPAARNVLGQKKLAEIGKKIQALKTSRGHGFKAA